MALKTQIKTLEEVDEALRPLYTQVGDVYVLDTDDGDFKTKLAEFRNNNISITKENALLKEEAELAKSLKAQLAALGGATPEEAAAALEKMKSIEEKKLIEAGEIDAVVKQRADAQVARLVADYDGKIKAIQKALEETQANESNYKSRLSEVVIDSSLQSAINSVGQPRKGAMRDLIARGKQLYTLGDDGKPVPMSDGTVAYGKDGKTPLSMEEWAQTQILEAPYLFEGSSGGGADGGDGANDSGSVIDGSNVNAIGANLENIAAGKVSVKMPS